MSGIPKRKTRWTRDEAIELCQELGPRLEKVGWGLALCGSVLIAGESRHDLDLIVFPHTTEKEDEEGLVDALVEAGITLRADVECVHRTWRQAGSRDTKHVEVYRDEHGRRIDLFTLR